VQEQQQANKDAAEQVKRDRAALLASLNALQGTISAEQLASVQGALDHAREHEMDE
jgi:hypothetical protein